MRVTYLLIIDNHESNLPLDTFNFLKENSEVI